MIDKLILDKTNLLLLIITLILIVFNIALLNYKILTPTMHNNEIKKQYEMNMQERKAQEEAELLDSDEVSEEEIQTQRINDLKSMGEADRMYTYCYKYLEMIEWQKYEEAYNILYDEFKNQYFPTLDSYKEYVINRYPDFMNIKYNSIERQGEYYVVTVTITDAYVTIDNIISMQQKFIIHEKGIDDFELSFQVI